MRLMFTFLALMGLSCAAFGGVIKGTVKDAADTSTLPGVVVNIKNTGKATATDGDGYFEITDVEDGKYELVFSMLTYAQQSQTVTVKNGIGQVDILLQPDKKTLSNVTISDTRITRTENAVLMEIKKSTSIVSGISAAQISKTMDRNAADVVKRIPGVTVSDDRFIVVRGLADRYNNVWLNDASAPSSEVDKRSFSFDLIPSGLIDRILVYKTPSPELPGDFAGGMVKIYTNSMPEKNQISFSYQASHRVNSTGTTFNYEEPSKTDWLGYDDGGRSLPENAPAYIKKSDTAVAGPFTKAMGNKWIIKQKTAGPDGRFNFSASGVKRFGGVKIGTTLAGNYSSISTNYSYSRQDYDSVDLNYYYNDQQSENKRSVGLLSNTSAIFGNHKIEFKNLYNQTGKSTVTLRNAVEDTANLSSDERAYFIGYESRASYCSQLSGFHRGNNERWKYNWTIGYADLFKNQPDQRRIRYTKNFGESDTMFNAQVVSVVNPYNGGGRLFFELQENTYSFNHQFTYSLPLWERTFDISAGNFIEQKGRFFGARNLGYTINAGGGNFLNADRLKHLPLDQIFADSNVGTRKSFMIDETTNVTDKYNAKNKMIASFILLKAPVTKKLNVVGGVRYEQNTQILTIDTALNVELETQFLLPSVNISYNISDKNLVRVAYGKTLNRPEFREQAPFLYYDFEERVTVSGALRPTTINGTNGDTLEVCQVQNIDARWEWYPETGEMIHIGGFYKSFKAPIQTVVTNVGGETKNLTFTNLDKAYSVGIEIDVRKNLSFLDNWLNTKVFRDFSLVGNAAFIKSELEFDSTKTDNANRKVLLAKSPLVGQSPYMYNAGLFYQSDKLALQGSVLYNVCGPRLFALGAADNNAESVLELPFATLDFTIQKTIAKHYAVTLGAQNLLDSKSQLVDDINRNSKYDADQDKAFKVYRPGRYYSLGVKINF